MSESLIFFLPLSKGGVDTFTNNYVKRIRDRKIKIVRYKNSDKLFQYIRETRNDRVEELEVFFSKYASQRSRYTLLKRIIMENDVLICNDSFELECINYFGLKNKVVYLLHGDLTHYRNTLDLYNKSMDLVVCVSNGLKNKYSEYFLKLKFVISHPFLIGSSAGAIQNRRKLNCIFIGKFEYLKGADLYLKLVAELGENFNWTIAAISDGSERSFLDKIPKDVNILMDQTNEEVISILKNMDILVFPSRTEGFGIAVLEAMSEGVVPIALDIPIGIPDQIVNAYNGFIIKEESWDRAIECLKNFDRDRNLLASMKANAIEYAKENFDGIRIAKGFVDEIDNVTIDAEKAFTVKKLPFLERLPEPLFRCLKFIHNRVKYG